MQGWNACSEELNACGEESHARSEEWHACCDEWHAWRCMAFICFLEYRTASTVENSDFTKEHFTVHHKGRTVTVTLSPLTVPTTGENP